MGKTATTIDEQISLLRQRGVEITDSKKAFEYLLDIGYFRLCSYLFPFEKSYPKLWDRDHLFVDGTKLEDAVRLYYFDFDLRHILDRYIERVEVSIRTFLTYSVSNKYKKSPTWFVDPNVVSSSYISGFEATYAQIKKKPVIRRHHASYINDKYAPAWKTIEFFTIGNIESLYHSLKSSDDKLLVAKHYGITQSAVFENYLWALRELRNACAHGGVLFDMKLARRIRKGPAMSNVAEDGNRLTGVLRVLDFMLGRVSKNRQQEMRDKVTELVSTFFRDNPSLASVIRKAAGNLDF